MKVGYDGSDLVHKDVYRNLMYTGDDKYSFVGESGFDNAVGACTQVSGFTEYSGGDDPSDEYWGLTFTAAEANSSVSFNSSDWDESHPVIEGAPQLATSTDGITWTPYEYGTEIQLANVGDKVYFAAKNGVTNSTAFSDGSNYYHRFTMTGKISASGEVFSLIINDESQLTTYQLSAGHLSALFRDCTSLTTAPKLSITNLAAGCYYSMFSGCTSLTTSPELPATTLDPNCYGGMFTGCNNLSSVTVKFTSWFEITTGDWLSGVSPSGTFTCPTALGTNETITRGVSNCPEGWTVVNT